jgi:hypothetical protein
MTVKINKPALNLREELASLRNQGVLPKEDKLYLDGLVSNGNFGTSSDWTLDTNWEISNGELHANSTAQYTSARQTLKTTVGKTYKATVTCTSYTSGSFRLYVHDGNAYQESATFTSTGTHTVTWKAHTSSDQIRVYSYGGTAVGTFDNVSVEEVGENLVTNGTFDYDGGWNKGTEWTISGGTASCDGSQTSSSSLDDVRTAPLNASVVTIQFTLSGNTAGAIQPRITGGYTISGAYVTGNGVKTVTLADTGNNLRVRFTVTSDFVGTIDNVIVTEGNHQVIKSIPYGYDVKDVYIDGELAREGEAYDYEVKTDGINQWLKPTIEPTATTETAVIGVRK